MVGQWVFVGAQVWAGVNAEVKVGTSVSCTPCPSLLVSRCWVMLLLLGGVWRLNFVLRVKAKARARS